jgi:hypothetical protein
MSEKLMQTKTLFISAGHSDSDPGAVGNGHTEAGIVTQFRDLMEFSISVDAYSDGTQPWLSKFGRDWIDVYPDIDETASIIDLAINREWPST